MPSESRWVVFAGKSENVNQVKEEFENMKLYIQYIFKTRLTNIELLKLLIDFAEEYKTLFAEFLTKKIKEVRK